MNIEDYKDTGKSYGINSVYILQNIDTGEYILYDIIEGTADKVTQGVTKSRIEQILSK